MLDVYPEIVHNRGAVIHERRLRATFLALSCLLTGATARAQAAAPGTAPRANASEESAVVEEISYAPTVGLLYGIGYAGMATGFWMAIANEDHPQAVRLAGAIILPSGAITTLFGPMLAHLDHGSFSKGMLSVGGQVAAVLVGVAAGYGTAKIAGADETGTAVLIGGASAHITWALFDTFYLAREELVLERTILAPSYSLVLGPEGFQARARFEF